MRVKSQVIDRNTFRVVLATTKGFRRSQLECVPGRARICAGQKDGFRGFVVEFYNIISDVVVQDGYQSVLNLRTTLNLISKRHSRIKRCSRETDGAGSYNSVFVALMTLQLGTGNQLCTNHTPYTSQSVHLPSLSSHPCL